MKNHEFQNEEVFYIITGSEIAKFDNFCLLIGENQNIERIQFFKL